MSARSSVARRLLLLQSFWDPERMQAAGLSYALDPWLAACWAGDAEGLRAARERHLGYFNVEPHAAGLVAGVVCALEEKAARAPAAERAAHVARIDRVKRSAAASLSGAADAFFWGALRPFSAAAGLVAGLALLRFGAGTAIAAGLAVSLLVFNVPAEAARRRGLSLGWELGEEALVLAAKLPARAWTRRLRLAAAAGAVLSAVLGLTASGLSAPAAARGACAAAAGLLLSWKGVPLLVQVAAAAALGAAAFAAGWIA
jgi:mannose/fructose/N-acetylgalactosamine-specific phosphotransferase system component IID